MSFNRLQQSVFIYYQNWGSLVYLDGLSRWHSEKDSACQCRRQKRLGFNPWVRKIPWRRKWQPTPVFLPGNNVDSRAWQATVHGVTKSRIHACMHYMYQILSALPYPWNIGATSSLLRGEHTVFSCPCPLLIGYRHICTHCYTGFVPIFIPQIEIYILTINLGIFQIVRINLKCF